MKKKLLAVAVSTAMMSSLALVGSALAADRVEVKVTSEPIQSRSTCDKVGGFSLEFDRGTTLVDGDRITIDTDYITPSNFTELCRSVDLMIAPVANASSTSGGSPGLSYMSPGHPIPVAGVASPVYYEVTPPSTALSGANFHVYGSAGTQRITFDVIGDVAGSAITVGNADPADKLVVKFLDQSVNADFDALGQGLWINTTPADTLYDAPAEVADNTLCLNVNEWDAATVNANMDSTADKFTFIPSNPQVAHIVAAASYAVVPCKGANCGTIPIGGDVEQSNPTCDSFTDWTTPDASASDDSLGYCTATDAHANNDLIIQKKSGAFAADDYEVTMEILVNGVAGDNGVYFDPDTEPAGSGGFTTDTLACDGGVDPLNGTYYQDGGTVVTTFGATGCDVDAANRAVTFVSNTTDLGLDGTSDDFLKLTVPTLVYDANEVTNADAVTVRVTLTRAPCGEIIVTDHCVGSLVSACSIIASGNTINYPYFTEGNGDGFWDGLAVTNLTASAGTATITMYETDGDVATATVPIAALSMYVNTLETMISDGTFVQTAGAGTLGDARSQLVVTSDTLTVDGFAMIGNNSTGVSMGYLPRMYNSNN